jgi:hypothetical protein
MGQPRIALAQGGFRGLPRSLEFGLCACCVQGGTQNAVVQSGDDLPGGEFVSFGYT